MDLFDDIREFLASAIVRIVIKERISHFWSKFPIGWMNWVIL